MSDNRGGARRVDHPASRWELLLYGFVRNVVVGFCRLFWRIEVHGTEHVPTTGPFILSGVHRSNIDTLLVSAVTRRRLRYMGKQEMWGWAPAGRFFTAMGGFPVDRGSADREAMRKCIAVIDGGEPLVVFPEGQRRSGPVIEDMFDGPSFIASRTAAPILPVGIGGAEAAMAIGAKMIRPAKIVLVIGPPIAAPTSDDAKRPSRRAIKAKTEELRTTLQSLFDDAQTRAGQPVGPGAGDR